MPHSSDETGVDAAKGGSRDTEEALAFTSTSFIPRGWSRPVLFETRLPFGPTGFRQDIPSVRYNRVEGLVIGPRLTSLEPDDGRRIKPVGQFAYAFALKKVRYDVGVEARPFPRIPELTGTVVGARYRRNTSTEDNWKAPWTENTLAAILFRNDFFDYYETVGWSAYVAQPLGRRIQVGAGFVAEDHRELDVGTSWSLFGGGARRPPLLIDEGNVRALRFTADAGRVRDLYEHPSGVAVRAEAEIAPDAFGGALNYSRVVADVRMYWRTSRVTHVATRVRAGYSGDDAPQQKLFALGGAGSVRGYPINWSWGNRMLLANVEYGLTEFDFGILGIQAFTFADAGYAGHAGGSAATDDWLVSAGGGVSIAGRNIRLELAFPLTDAGSGRDPRLWFRLYPPF